MGCSYNVLNNSDGRGKSLSGLERGVHQLNAAKQNAAG